VYSDPVPVHIVTHPLVHDALVTLRDKHTTPEHFRRAATRISVLLATVALSDLPARDVTVNAKTSGWGWLLGGGAEAWIGRRFALYGEFGGAGIKGDSEIADQGRIDNRIRIFIFGGRILIR